MDSGSVCPKCEEMPLGKAITTRGTSCKRTMLLPALQPWRSSRWRSRASSLLFLPLNTTPLSQPVASRSLLILRNYTNVLFERCLEVTSESNLTLREFWKEHFTILTCLRLTDKAWGGVSSRTISLEETSLSLLLRL